MTLSMIFAGNSLRGTVGPPADSAAGSGERSISGRYSVWRYAAHARSGENTRRSVVQRMGGWWKMSGCVLVERDETRRDRENTTIHTDPALACALANDAARA